MINRFFYRQFSFLGDNLVLNGKPVSRLKPVSRSNPVFRLNPVVRHLIGCTHSLLWIFIQVKVGLLENEAECTCQGPGGRFNIKMSSYQYRISYITTKLFLFFLQIQEITVTETKSMRWQVFSSKYIYNWLCVCTRIYCTVNTVCHSCCHHREFTSWRTHEKRCCYCGFEMTSQLLPLTWVKERCKDQAATRYMRLTSWLTSWLNQVLRWFFLCEYDLTWTRTESQWDSVKCQVKIVSEYGPWIHRRENWIPWMCGAGLLANLDQWVTVKPVYRRANESL